MIKPDSLCDQKQSRSTLTQSSTCFFNIVTCLPLILMTPIVRLMFSTWMVRLVRQSLTGGLIYLRLSLTNSRISRTNVWLGSHSSHQCFIGLSSTGTWISVLQSMTSPPNRRWTTTSFQMATGRSWWNLPTTTLGFSIRATRPFRILLVGMILFILPELNCMYIKPATVASRYCGHWIRSVNDAAPSGRHCAYMSDLFVWSYPMTNLWERTWRDTSVDILLAVLFSKCSDALLGQFTGIFPKMI